MSSSPVLTSAELKDDPELRKMFDKILRAGFQFSFFREDLCELVSQFMEMAFRGPMQENAVCSIPAVLLLEFTGRVRSALDVYGQVHEDTFDCAQELLDKLTTRNLTTVAELQRVKTIAIGVYNEVIHHCGSCSDRNGIAGLSQQLENTILSVWKLADVGSLDSIGHSLPLFSANLKWSLPEVARAFHDKSQAPEKPRVYKFLEKGKSTCTTVTVNPKSKYYSEEAKAIEEGKTIPILQKPILHYSTEDPSVILGFSWPEPAPANSENDNENTGEVSERCPLTPANSEDDNDSNFSNPFVCYPKKSKPISRKRVCSEDDNESTGEVSERCPSSDCPDWSWSDYDDEHWDVDPHERVPFRPAGGMTKDQLLAKLDEEEALRKLGENQYEQKMLKEMIEAFDNEKLETYETMLIDHKHMDSLLSKQERAASTKKTWMLRKALTAGQEAEEARKEMDNRRVNFCAEKEELFQKADDKKDQLRAVVRQREQVLKQLKEKHTSQ